MNKLIAMTLKSTLRAQGVAKVAIRKDGIYLLDKEGKTLDKVPAEFMDRYFPNLSAELRNVEERTLTLDEAISFVSSSGNLQIAQKAYEQYRSDSSSGASE